jgi:predicted dehydrogenase
MAQRHAATIAASERMRLAIVVDRDADRAEALASRYGALWSTDPRAAEEFDAAIIAVATDAHVALAIPLLAAGVAVLVEKPVSIHLAQTMALIDTAEQHGTPLQCGFVERFNPAIFAVQQLGIGRAMRVDARRAGPPPANAYSSVVHDLLLHDLDLAVTLGGGGALQAVRSASTSSIVGSPWAEQVGCLIEFASGAIASLSASRLSDRRERSMTLTYSDRIIELDLIRHEMATIADGVRTVRHTTGDALSAQLEHFANLVEGRLDSAAERTSIVAAHQIADDIARATSDQTVRSGR